MFAISLWYCGGCNAQIDRSRIVTELKEGLKKMARKGDFASTRERPVDMVLLVNVC
jgi:hypothetical protein